MSLEQVLLIAFLAVLPLVQYLIRLLGKRNELPERAESPPPLRRSVIHYLQPALQNVRPAASSDTMAPIEYINKPAGPAGVEHQPAAATRLGESFDARRAIVVMTLIGPCRATSPHSCLDNDV
jgi:hypothetical protein